MTSFPTAQRYQFDYKNRQTTEILILEQNKKLHFKHFDKKTKSPI